MKKLSNRTLELAYEALAEERELSVELKQKALNKREFLMANHYTDQIAEYNEAITEVICQLHKTVSFLDVAMESSKAKREGKAVEIKIGNTTRVIEYHDYVSPEEPVAFWFTDKSIEEFTPNEKFVLISEGIHRNLYCPVSRVIGVFC